MQLWEEVRGSYLTGNEDTEETALTEHVVSNNHSISRTSFKLLEEVRDIYKLNVTESFHIYKNRSVAVNKDDGNGYTNLFELIKRRTVNVVT